MIHLLVADTRKSVLSEILVLVFIQDLSRVFVYLDFQAVISLYGSNVQLVSDDVSALECIHVRISE